MGQAPLHVVCRESLVHGSVCTKKLMTVMLRYGANPAQLDHLGHEPMRYLHWDVKGPRSFLEQAKIKWYRRLQRLLFQGRGAGVAPVSDDAGGHDRRGPDEGRDRVLLPELLEDILHFL